MNNLNLENVKTGDEITTIRQENGKTVYHGLWTVGEWSENHKAFRLFASRNNKITGILPPDGKGYHAMHPRKTPHFYYSANPAHIKKVKESIKKAEKTHEKKKKLLAEKRELFSPLLESYRDNEECFTFEYLSTESLERLSVSQIKTLKKWLTV